MNMTSPKTGGFIKMKKFKVMVTRIGYSYNEIEVEAPTAEEAEQIAEESALDCDWSERRSDYVVDGVLELKEGE